MSVRLFSCENRFTFENLLMPVRNVNRTWESLSLITPYHTVCNPKSRNGAPRWEIDIIAANGDEVVAVEVKTTLKVRQVTDFIETLKVFPEEAPSAYRGKRTYGAVAYLKADEAADGYAERQGLYVIRATGSSASITNQEGFKPRTFGA